MNTVTEPAPTVKPRRAHKPAAPAHGSCRWLIRPIVARGFASGILDINGTEYAVTFPQDRSGVRLTKDRQTQYHVDLHKQTCDCPAMQFNPPPGGCKHIRASQAALAWLDARDQRRPLPPACPFCQRPVEASGVCPTCAAEEDARLTAGPPDCFADIAPDFEL